MLARTLVRLSGGGVLDRCGFCGGADGPFTRVQGAFTVLICPRCLADRARGRGPYPNLTDEELRGGLDQLPSWVLAQKAAAFSAPTGPTGCHPVCVRPLRPSARPRWPSAWDRAIGRG
jgi:hypothetical protein